MAVIGGTGFVGTGVARELASQGHSVSIISAPRVDNIHGASITSPPDLRPPSDLVKALTGIDTVVIASGIPDALETNFGRLLCANAASALLSLRAAVTAQVSRVIHISSSVVQGDLPQLDSTRQLKPLTPYALSKAWAESWLLNEYTGETAVCVYRPPSVHSPDRRITITLARVARNGLAGVAGDGSRPTPQVLLSSVTSAIAHMASSTPIPPEIVAHPWEGLTCNSLLVALGGRPPHKIPLVVVNTLLTSLSAASKFFPRISAQRRRLELLLLGQIVAPSWLEESGWQSPNTYDDWSRLGSQLALRAARTRLNTG